jgi:hypothetical protein
MEEIMKGKIITKAVPYFAEFFLAKIPSPLFLIGSYISICIALILYIMGKKKDSIFVGHWAPTFLLLGLYRKLIKMVL